MSKVLMDLALGTVRVPFHGTCLVLPFAVHPWITQMQWTLGDLGAEENLGFNYPQTVAFSIIMWSGTWLCTTKTCVESYWFNPEIPPQNNYRSLRQLFIGNSLNGGFRQISAPYSGVTSLERWTEMCLWLSSVFLSLPNSSSFAWYDSQQLWGETEVQFFHFPGDIGNNLFFMIVIALIRNNMFFTVLNETGQRSWQTVQAK